MARYKKIVFQQESDSREDYIDVLTIGCERLSLENNLVLSGNDSLVEYFSKGIVVKCKRTKNLFRIRKLLVRFKFYETDAIFTLYKISGIEETPDYKYLVIAGERIED